MQPAIAGAQGAIEVNRAEALEALEKAKVGPALELPTEPGRAGPAKAAASNRTILSDIFVASLLLGGIARFAALHGGPAWLGHVDLVFLAAQLIGAIAVMIQRYRGSLDRRMGTLGIVTLALIGLEYYASVFLTAIASSAAGRMATSADVPIHTGSAVVQGVEAGATLALGLIGLAFALIPPRRRPGRVPDIG